MYPDDLAEMAQWVSGLVGPAMRVLEIGCGDGELTTRLAEAGVDVLGVDPNAPAGAHVRAVAVEELDDEPFDVLFASVSLHHLDDPEQASAALRRLTKPGTISLVREFDKDTLDHEPTLRWWFHQLHAERAVTHRVPDHVDDIEHTDLVEHFDEFVTHWRHDMDHHVLPWPTVLRTLEDAGFTTQQMDTGPYLFRWGLREPIRPLEDQLIGQRRINAVGVRWQGRRLS